MAPSEVTHTIRMRSIWGSVSRPVNFSSALPRYSSPCESINSQKCGICQTANRIISDHTSKASGGPPAATQPIEGGNIPHTTPGTNAHKDFRFKGV